MGIFDLFWDVIAASDPLWAGVTSSFNPKDWFGPIVDKAADGDFTGSTPAYVSTARAKKNAAIVATIAGACVAAPLAYIAYKGRKWGKKRKPTENEIMTGVALENASKAATTLSMTAIATPVISASLAYLLIETMENYPIKVRNPTTGELETHQGLISGHFGDSMQGLITVAAAAPMIQGFAEMGSAFVKRSKG